MGRILQIKCRKCSYEKELHTGVGFADCEFETLLSALNEDGQAKLNEAKACGASDFSIDRQPFMCLSCGSIYAAAAVSYKQNGKREILWSVCPCCGKDEKRPLSDSEACPSCGGETDIIKAGLWD